MKLEDDYVTARGSRRGTEIAYTVEARMNYSSPAKVGTQIFDNRWRTVEFDRSQIGVPTAPASHQKALEHGLLSYPAAQALRWWVHAAAEAENIFCIETRLIKHMIEHSHSITAVSQHGFVGIEDRSALMPDYSEKE